MGPHRLANLYGWLADLKTTLPPHAGETVCESLRRWESWHAALPDDALDPETETGEARMADVNRVLSRQGEIWRACLSGEKDPTDTLQASNYVEAANTLVENAVRLSRQLPAVLRFGVPGALLITLVGVLAASLTGNGTAVVGALGAFAGALGISWAGVRQTVGSAAAKVREPLWDAALDDAIVDAITRVDELSPEPAR